MVTDLYATSKPDERAPEKPPSAYVMFANRMFAVCLRRAELLWVLTFGC